MAIRSELTLGIRGFQTSLQRATQEVRTQSGVMRRESAGVGASLSQGMGGAASSIVGRLAPVLSMLGAMNQVKQSLRWADDLADLTDKLQDNAEALQRVDFAAQQAASIGVAQVADSMMRLERALGDVESKNVASSLEGLGLSVRELQSMSLDDKVLALSDAFQKARAEGTGLKDLQDLLGRSAADLVPLLSRTGDELRAMFEAAPVLAGDAVIAMAELNDQIDAIKLQAHGFLATVISSVQEGMQMKVDLVMTGSFDEMSSRAAKRQDKRRGKAADDERGRVAKANAQADEREEAIALREQETAARAAESALQDLDRTLAGIAARDLELLPTDEQIAELGSQLETLLSETLALDLSPSVEGLREVLAERLAQGDALPGEGVGSALEAAQWVEAAEALRREIGKLEETVAKDEAARLADLERARERSDAAEFRLLDPEEQMARLRDRLAEAVSFGGLLDFDDADVMAHIRGLREQGRHDEAADLAGTLTDARRLAESMDDGSGPVASGEQGSFATLMDQIFGRGVPEQQLDRLREIADGARDQQKALDKILVKMDEPPPTDVFTDFPR